MSIEQKLPGRLPLFVRHVMYNLRGGFLVRPLIIALSLGFLGGLISTLEDAYPVLNSWIPAQFFPTHSDPQLAQVILEGIAESMMTVVSIVFAILLMTLTLASMQFSPRIIVSFSQDRVTQQTLGIFLGTFSYCLAALPSARSLPHPMSPVLTIIGAMVLALACVAWLLFFIHHISQAISVNYIIDKIASETEAVIDQTMPYPLRQTRVPGPDESEPNAREKTVLSQSSGYVRYIDTKQLVFLAKSYGVTVRALRRVGHFVPTGIPLLIVSKGDRLTPAREAQIRSAFDFGPTRTLEQDIEYGILQIVDIALKAISPAVNDPSTAIGCVDQLSRILIRVAAREPAASLLYDPPGVLRVSVPWLRFDRLVESAFEQIRLYSKSDMAVSLRMLRALGDIAVTTPEPAYRTILIAQGRRIVDGCVGALPEEELSQLQNRLLTLEQFTSDPRLDETRDTNPLRLQG